MKQIVCYLFLSFYSALSFAQKHTVSGYVKEEETGEFLMGANVYIKETLQGVNTNQYGFYSITLPNGNYTLVISFIGFQEYSQKIQLNQDLRVNVALSSSVIIKETIEVTGEKADKNVSGTEMGTVKMDMEQVKKLPAFMGEVDVLKTIQLTPGVKAAGEGNAGFYVRGGGPDQNLILLDEAQVYNAAHLLGFFSVFNGDAIKNINLIKGGMPAQYGGRLASVLDISMKEGNNRDYHVEGGIGLISSRLTVQGPIKKDTGSFIISARRTYIDVLMQPFIKKTSPFKGSGYYFYDLNTKLNYRLSDKDRLFLSGYFGRDVFSYLNKDSEFNISIPWGNATTSLRWNHLFNNKLFMNTSFVFSDYNFSFGAEQSGFEFKLFSGITDYNLKTDFGFFPSPRHEIKFGANYTYHTFVPSNASAKSGEVKFDLGKVVKHFAHESALYVSDDVELNEWIRFHAGIRVSDFMMVGPFDRYLKDSKGYITDTIFYRRFEKIKNYIGPEPRLSLRVAINKRSSVKASFTQNYQYVHLASSSAMSLPTDVWMPSSDVVRPQFGTQYAIGYFRNFLNDMFESSIEAYYKNMKNQVEYKEGALPEDNVKDNTDNALTFGSGESYGTELYLKKRTGKFNGWVGYTLSWTTRTFPMINSGKTYYARYDRRHDASLVLTYDHSKHVSVSAVFVYGTGNAISLPQSMYFFEGELVYDYGPRNWYRMPAYHRLDISVTYTPDKEKKLARQNARKTKRYERKGMAYQSKTRVSKYESSWSFSVYNVYNRRNPYFIYINTERDEATANLTIQAKQVSLFPILPSITWNFKW